MRVDHLWHELEQEPKSLTGGWVQRRVLPETALDVFLGLDRPGNRRVLRLSFAESSVPDNLTVTASKGVDAVIAQEVNTGRRSILLTLLDSRYQEVFTSLCVDLIDVLKGSGTNEPAAVRAFLGRVARWQQFLERVGEGTLSADAQLGLYAELWLLYHDLLGGPPGSAGVEFWTGPDRTHQDFQLNGHAIETKATRQANPVRIVISSERQLDTTGIQQLLLVHTVWDARRSNGSTLPELVDLVRTRLDNDAPRLSHFENLLLGGGYLGAHRAYYESNGYTLRSEAVFEVRRSFPRLTAESLPRGISTVRYSIDLAECRPFEVGRAVLLRMILESTRGPG